MNQKTNTRLNAVQSIYNHLMTSRNIDDILLDMISGNTGRFLLQDIDGKEVKIDLEKPNQKMLTDLVHTVKEKQAQFEQIIENTLSDKWDKSRIDNLLKSVLFVGLAEFFVHPDLDTPIIISEYTDICKSFYDGPEVSLTNAILNKFAKVIKG